MTSFLRDPSRLPFLDRLTQLYNWWFMAQYLRERFGWIASQQIPLSVLLLDLDDFRTVNERHGRLAGDVVLRQVALRLQEGRRRGGYAVRYAGDEFFVFLEGTGSAEALATAEEIRDRVGGGPILVPHAASGVTITASLGVATFPEEAQSASGLVEKVRRAVTQAKRLGKNRVSRDVGEQLPTDKEALKRFHRPRLLGREGELDLCRTLFQKAPSGPNRVVLIEGDHGAGKSRLLSELPGLARSAGLPFIQGGCLPEGQAVPYGALKPWVQEYFDRSPETAAPIAARLSGPKRAALGAWLNVLKPGDATNATIPDPERRRLLFDGVLELLCLISETTPLVVLLENLQWADEASFEVLLHLLSREDGKLLVCATALPGDRGEAQGGSSLRTLSHFLPSFEASPHFHRLTLAPLTESQVGQLAADILYHAIPTRFRQQLFQLSRGVPLLVEETIKGLITRGILREEEGAWNCEQVTPEDFPASADEAIARGLENLDPDTLEVISEAAVIGPDVDLPLLADVLGQDPGETLHLVDRGRRYGLFQAIDPVADAGEIRFANERLREIVYGGLDDVRRRNTHHKVAQVYERLAGPEPGDALGPVTYHFERSDDTAKAGFYREKLNALRRWLFSAADVGRVGAGRGGEVATGPGEAGAGGGGETGTVRVRIPEASQPLDENHFPLVVPFVKTLTLACKNMRVYPEESQLVQKALDGATYALWTLLVEVPALTLAEERGVLRVNRQAVEGRALAAIGHDLLRLFTEHGIRSITFTRGMVEGEIRELLKILSGRPEGIRPEVDAWEELLASRGILHVGVFPALYLAGGRRAAVETAAEGILDDEDMRLSAEVFRSLAGAVDNLRIYPPENELNLLIQEKLERQAQALLERIPAVTLALAEDSIVINGARANPRWFGLAIPLLHKLLQDHGLTSVTLMRGMTRADLSVFLTELARAREAESPDPSLWGKVLEDRGVRTIEVGSRFYAAARGSLTGGGRGQAGAGGAGGGRAGAPIGASGGGEALDSEDRLFERVAQWLESPSAAPEFRQEEIPAALESWLGSDRQDLARLLWERIASGLANPVPGIRQRAASALHLLLAEGSAQTLSWLRGLSLEPLEKALLAETSPQPFHWEVRAAADALKLSLKDGDLGRSATLAQALGRGQAGKADQKKLLSHATGTVETLAAAGVFEPLHAALKERDPARREQGRAVLAALGEGALGFVASIVTQEEAAEVRKLAASVLRSLPGAGLRLLTPQLQPPTPGEVSRRIVSVLDVVAPELGSDFVSLLAHPDVLVRAEFAALLSRAPRSAALKFLERALGEREPAVLAGALESMRGLQATELLDVIVGLVRRDTTAEVLRAACLALGQLKDQRALGPLVEVLQRRPRFLGLIKGLPETVRAAAARALGELAVPEAQQALQAVLKDPSMAVRSTARMALARLHRGREPR